MPADPANLLEKEAALQPIRWSEAFQMGDSAIDDEHRDFVGIVNRLNAAIREHAAAAGITAICDALVDHAARHFASEERMMERLGFGGLPDHRREHERLLPQIRAEAARMRTADGRTELIAGALAIKDALLTHMFRVDVQYKSLLEDVRGR